MDAHPDTRRPDPSHGRALSFATVADAYDRSRPSYPDEAVEWMVGRSASTVVELGAGTGKLTDSLVALGHDVLATDPLEEMLAPLRLRHPDLRTACAPAEAIPVATRTVDTVVAAQSFHWFDADRALREAARVLKPEGRIALAWNDPDARIPWVRRLKTLVYGPRSAEEVDPTDTLVSSTLFGYVEEASFRFWQPLRKDQLRDLVASRSAVAVMDAMARERLLRKVDELYDDSRTGPDGLLMPYRTRCYRAVVRPRGLIDEPEHSADLTAAAQAVREQLRLQRVPEGLTGAGVPADPGTTLIDFR